MDIITATVPDEAPSLDEECVSGAFSGLSELQRDFARHFVLTGGKPGRSAILAGYSAKSAHISAHRNLCNRKVLAAIKRLAVANVEAALPVAIRTLLDVCMNSSDDRARVSAASKLLELGGMVKAGGPTVNVQVNVNGQQVNQLKEEIWSARSARLSDIDGTMSDFSPQIEGRALPTLEAPTEDGVGGVQPAGSHAGTHAYTSLSQRVLPQNDGDDADG